VNTKILKKHTLQAFVLIRRESYDADIRGASTLLENSDHNIYDGHCRDFIFDNFPPFSDIISSAGY
jgi:hypothetical protein